MTLPSAAAGQPLPDAVNLLQLQLDLGLRTIVTVPCSITAAWHAAASEAWQRGALDLVTSTHEGNLVGLAAGSWFADGCPAVLHLQNSGLANAADGLVSCAGAGVFAIPLALIVTYRGATEADDSEPHQEVGRRTDALVDTLFAADALIAGTRLGDEPLLEAWARVLRAARAGGQGVLKLSPLALRQEGRERLPMAKGPGSMVSVSRFADTLSPSDPSELWPLLQRLALEKGTLSLPPSWRRPGQRSRDEAILAILEAHPGAAVLFCNGFTARAAQAIADRPCHFYNVGYMGGTLAIGWALARRRPDLEVVVVDGDQNAQMSAMKDHLVQHYPANLHWYVLDNGVGASVGGAVSLPLSPLYGALARVLPTSPDPSGSFPHPRVHVPPSEGAGSSHTLAPLARRFRRWIADCAPSPVPDPP